MDIYLKKDYMHYTGSFKERGARYTLMMLEPEQKSAGVIAASAGNHALALAYHGGQLNISVTVVMPIVAPIMKVENCKKYGANVIVHGKDIGESRERQIHMKVAGRHFYGTENLIWAGFRPVGNRGRSKTA